MGYHDRYINDDRAAWHEADACDTDADELCYYDDADVTSNDGSDIDTSPDPFFQEHHPGGGDADPVRWAHWRAQDVWVCSEGAVRLAGAPFHHVHTGTPVLGTPYREFIFPDGQRMLMHDLVWRAFHGPPPPGWVVRHASNPPVPDAAHPWMYNNALGHLNIYYQHCAPAPPVTILQ